MPAIAWDRIFPSPGRIRQKRGPKEIDLTGHRFGKLVAVARAPKSKAKHSQARWYCQCDCGNRVIKFAFMLRQGKSTDCNIQPCSSHGIVSIIGQRFGTLTVIDQPSKPHRGMCIVECDCGRIKDVTVKNLRKGNTTSCGRMPCRGKSK